MLVDSKTIKRLRLYEDGCLTITKSGSGNRKAKGGKELGKKQKYFDLKGKKKIIRSSIIKQWNFKKHRILFGTLTFPDKIKNKQANECLHRFLDNLYHNYNLHSHVVVKELHKSGNPHFHVLFDIPYIAFNRINSAWNSAYRDFFSYSSNSFTTGKKKTVTNIKGVIKYASKYVSKAEVYNDIPEEYVNDYRKNRLFFCSYNVLSVGYNIIPAAEDYIKKYYGAILIVETDYFDFYFLRKFTGNVSTMQKFVENYHLFCWFISVFHYLNTVFLLFFLKNYCFNLKNH